MSDLQNQTPADTYKGLLQVGDYTNGVVGNSEYVQDGEGINSALSISTTKVGVGTVSPSAELDVNGNVVADEYALNGTGSSSSAVAIHAPATNELAIRTNTAERVRIDSSGHVGIGITPAKKLHIHEADSSTPSQLHFTNATTGGTDLDGTTLILDSSNLFFRNRETNGEIGFQMQDGGVEAMRIDSAGNVGINSTSPNGGGITGRALDITDSVAPILRLNRSGGADYSIFASGTGELQFYDNNSGSASLSIESGDVLPGTDDTQDLGSTTKRWDDIYATNTTIQSSDRDLKQDIEELSEAETRVAKACKGLLRKYRWKDAVAQKGDEARIHFGIIAQDLEDAFTTEGLDAGRYGMFVKNTWWQADRVIPAVEAVDAVYDEEGDEVSSAIEAQPERTVTDIFSNSKDAPEGAIEVTQRGVRYSELLAFIIAAI